MARLDRATQYSPEMPVITGSPGLAFGSPEDDRWVGCSCKPLKLDYAGSLAFRTLPAAVAGSSSMKT